MRRFFKQNDRSVAEDGPVTGAGGVPASWHPRPGAPTGGPLVIFDLDGVISDASHRQHFMRGAHKDFRGFFTSAGNDPPFEAGLAMAASVADTHAVAILTARPDYITEMTRSWLAAHEVRHDLLILRPRRGQGSQGPSADFKRHELERLRAAGYQPVLAIDDDQRIIDMYRSEGVFALYRHSGYYDR